MSTVYNSYIAACQAAYQPCGTWLGNSCNKDPLCQMGCRNSYNCVACLYDMFWIQIHHTRRYQCVPITYSYVIRFMNVYASEIYHILSPHDDIWNDISGKCILSLGCGPASELVGIEKILYNKNLTFPCQYVGFDTNLFWSYTQSILSNILSKNSCTIRPYFEHGRLLPENTLLPNAKLLILNRVVSDIYVHSEPNSTTATNAFLDSLSALIDKMPNESFVLINDVNSNKMGRDEIETWANSSGLKIVSKGIFEYSGREYYKNWNNDSQIIPQVNLVFDDIVPDNYLHRVNSNECRSAFILLKKRGAAFLGEGNQ